MRLKTDHYVFLIVLVIATLSVLILIGNFTGFATAKPLDRSIKFSETIPPEIINYECPLSFELVEQQNQLTGSFNLDLFQWGIPGNEGCEGENTFGIICSDQDISNSARFGTGQGGVSINACTGQTANNNLCEAGEGPLNGPRTPATMCANDCCDASSLSECSQAFEYGGMVKSFWRTGTGGGQEIVRCEKIDSDSVSLITRSGSPLYQVFDAGSLKGGRYAQHGTPVSCTEFCGSGCTVDCQTISLSGVAGTIYGASYSTLTCSTPSTATGGQVTEGGTCYRTLSDAFVSNVAECQPGLLCDFDHPGKQFSEQYRTGICISKTCTETPEKVQLKRINDNTFIQEKPKKECGIKTAGTQVLNEVSFTNYCAYSDANDNFQPIITFGYRPGFYQDCIGPCRDGSCVCNENGVCDSGETLECSEDCEVPDRLCTVNSAGNRVLTDLNSNNILETKPPLECSGNNLISYNCVKTPKSFGDENNVIKESTQNCPYGCDSTNLRCNTAPECEISYSNYLARDSIFIDGTDIHNDVTACFNGDFYRAECSTTITALNQRFFPNAQDTDIGNKLKKIKKVLDTDCASDQTCHNIDGCRNTCDIQNDKLSVKFNSGLVHEVDNVKTCWNNNQQVKELACKPFPTGFNLFGVSYGSDSSDQVGVKYTDCPNGCINGECIQVTKTCADYFNDPNEYSILFSTPQGYIDNPQKQFDNTISFSYSVSDPNNPSQFYDFNNLKILIDNQELTLTNPVINSRKRYDATNVNLNPNTAGKSTIKIMEGNNLCIQKEVNVGTYCENSKKEWNEFCDSTDFGITKPTCNNGQDLVTCNPDCTLNFNACAPTTPTGRCGDGIIQTNLGEYCDNGEKDTLTQKSPTEYNSNEPNFACREDCTTRRCGDLTCDNLHNENAGSCPLDCANICAQVFTGDNANLLFYPDPSGDTPDLMYHTDPVDQSTTITLSYRKEDHEKFTPTNLFLKINGGSPLSGDGKNYGSFSMISFNNLNLGGRTSTVQLTTTGDVSCFPPKSVTVKNCAENFVNTQIDFTERQGTLPKGPQNRMELLNPPAGDNLNSIGYTNKNLVFKIDGVEVIPDANLEADIELKNKPSSVQVIDKNTNQICKEITSLNWFDTTAPPCNNNNFCDTEESVGTCNDCQPDTCRNHICEQGLPDNPDSYKETFDTCSQDCLPACDTNNPCPNAVTGDVCCNNKCMNPPAEGQIIQNCKYVSLSTTTPVKQPAPKQPVYVAPEREYKARELGVPVKHCPNTYTIPANKKFKLNYLNPTTYGERPDELERLSEQQLPVYVTCEGQENMDLITKGIKNIYSKEFRLALTQPVQCHVRVLDYRAIITVDPSATEISSRRISQEEIFEIIGTQPTITQSSPQQITPSIPTTQPTIPKAQLPAPTLPTPSVPVQQPIIPAPVEKIQTPSPIVPTTAPVTSTITPKTPVQPVTPTVPTTTKSEYPTIPTTQNPIIYTSKPAKGKTVTIKIKSSSTKDEILVNILSDASKYPKVMKAQKVESGIYEIKITPYTNREELT